MEEIIKQHIVEDLVKAYNVSELYKNDLIQHIYLILLLYDQPTLQYLVNKKQIKFFIARIIRNQWFSKTSTFYKLYKKYNALKDENYEPKETEELEEPDE